MKDIQEDAFEVNQKELMDYYGYNGAIGNFLLKMKLVRNWFLHSMAYSCPDAKTIIRIQRMRGVSIGEHCHINPYVLIDLIYPSLVKIENNVTIGSNSSIFAHVNPTANLFLKRGAYPRKIEPVTIKSGAVIFPGSIITSGVTIGENSVIGAGSVVYDNIPDYSVALGNPARVIKKIERD